MLTVTAFLEIWALSLYSAAGR